MAENGNGKSWTERYRFLTPIFLLLLNLLGGMIISNQNTIINKVNEIDSKMFIHLTNAELHIPRATIISRDEFEIYQKMRDQQMYEIKNGMNRIEILLQQHISKP